MKRKSKPTIKRAKKRETPVQKSVAKNAERGFDFGHQQRVMAMPSTDFNQALRDAEVIGCAYGYCKVDGMPQPVPSITLVGRNSSAFVRAYECFASWGCQEDGDVVDVDLLLQPDGGYDLWIGSEIERSLYRTIPQADLYDPIVVCVSWRKHFDTTNEMVHTIKQYCETGLHPVVISAAIGDPKNPTSLQIKPVTEWQNILKFRLGIIENSKSLMHARFAYSNEKITQKQGRPPHQESPEDICRRRTRTLDSAFPVSRERVRRSSLVQEVRKLNGFEDVSETQVVQGAINLMISDVLVPGDKHYRQVRGDYSKAIWHAIESRIEIVDWTRRPADQEPSIVAHQIELDVRATLSMAKARNLEETFPRLQGVFRQEGYVND